MSVRGNDKNVKHQCSPSEARDLVLAACVAHKLKIAPVWLFLLSPPSSGKTSLLSQLPAGPLPKEGETMGPDDIVSLSKITPRSLLSGLKKKGQNAPGLLEAYLIDLITGSY